MQFITSTTETYLNWPFFTTLGIVFCIAISIVIFLQYRRANLKVIYIKGKLIRKVKDMRDEERNIQNIAGTRAFGLMHSWRNEGETVRYYITFETDKGIKSFTVSERTYHAIKKNQKGTIGMKGKKFVSFKRN
jgi:hypothetical protein